MLSGRTSAFPLSRLREEMDRLFNGYSDGFDFMGPATTAAFPALNLWESENELIAEAEVPGLRMEDLEILVLGNELQLKGSRKTREEGRDTAYHRKERGEGSFSRKVRLPMDIDSSRVEATLKDGVLTVKLPKAEAAKPRKIDVKYAKK